MNRSGVPVDTVTFGVLEDNGEGRVVGPLRPDEVQYGHWYPVTEVARMAENGDMSAQPMTMVTLNFNKYNSALPPWEKVVEAVFVGSPSGSVADQFYLAKVYKHVGTQVSGRLKTVQLALTDVFPYECEGDIIECSDTRDEAHSGSERT